MRYVTLPLILLSLSLSSCHIFGEARCTDCNAYNYEEFVEDDDGSCAYANEEKLGTYTVTDSIYGPPVPEWEVRTYSIEITREECNPYGLEMSNPANLSTMVESFSATGTSEDDSFELPSQQIGPNLLTSITCRFAGDSLLFELSYINEFGESFDVRGYGLK